MRFPVDVIADHRRLGEHESQVAAAHTRILSFPHAYVHESATQRHRRRSWRQHGRAAAGTNYSKFWANFAPCQQRARTQIYGYLRERC